MSARTIFPVAWRKSSYSSANGNCVEVAGWYKSSFSSANGNCVEVAQLTPRIGVRDSKNPDGGVLTFAASDWSAFLTAVRSDQHR